MTDYKIADISKADKGRDIVEASYPQMKGLIELKKKHSEKKVLAGKRIAGCGHVTYQTVVLIESLVECGAEVRWCACDTQTTRDKAAAALAKAGVPIFARWGASKEEFESWKEEVLKFKDGGPHILLDYGSILTSWIHEKHPDMLKDIKGIVEHISIAKYYKLLKESSFKGPVFNCIESKVRTHFEDFYGMRETVIETIKKATNIQISGKRCLICGFGDIGKGIAQSLSHMGAQVIVAEIDPVCGLQAAMEGYEVTSRDEAISKADIIITATGGIDVISGEILPKIKDGAILAGFGYQDGEIDTDWIEKHKVSHITIKPHVDKFTFDCGRSIILLARGSLAQLCLAGGYSSFIMSVSFSVTFLSAIQLVDPGATEYPASFCVIPRKIDEEISEVHLTSLGWKLDKLGDKQAEHLGVAVGGPYKHYPTEY